jgi:hypothetical protein
VVEFHAPLSIDTTGGRKALANVAEAIVRRGQARALAGLPPQMPIAMGDASGELSEGVGMAA